MLMDLAINIVAAIVFFAMGLFAASARRWFRHRAFRRLWTPVTNGDSVTVVVSTRPGPNVSSTPRVSVREMRAFLRISEVLNSLRTPVEPADSETDLEDLSDKTLVLLGGPKANAVTEHLWGRLCASQPVHLDLETHSIASGARRYEPVKDASGHWTEDFAILIRARDPRHPSRGVFVAAGCHGFGTYGAARVISDRTLAREIVARTRGDDFVAIVKVHLRSGALVDCRIEECYVYPQTPLPS